MCFLFTRVMHEEMVPEMEHMQEIEMKFKFWFWLALMCFLFTRVMHEEMVPEMEHMQEIEMEFKFWQHSRDIVFFVLSHIMIFA